MSNNEIFNMYFGITEDTRCKPNVTHKLVDILKLVMIAILCGMDELDKIVDYGESKKEFLKKEFDIKSIPSKSTLSRVIAILNPDQLSLSIISILKMLVKNKEEQIMLDGKAIKSTDAIRRIKTMMNIVTAYTDTGISLGQITVEDKSNEIPAVRKLIDIIDVKNVVITTDAMHCQKETAERIIENKGEYVIQLKANQGKFYEDVYAMFEDKYMDMTDKECEYETYSTIEKSHGRIETRTCYVLSNFEYFKEYFKEWKGLKKIFAIKREIEQEGKRSIETSCYISSKDTNAENLMKYARNHWEIESMHHILDVTYDEDRCKLLTQKAQENLNIFRKMGISIHKNALKNKKQTVKSSMFNCLLNDSRLLEILQFCNN